MARVHKLETKLVAEEGAVRFRIFAVDNDVSARDHLHLLEAPSSSTPWTLALHPPSLQSIVEIRQQNEQRQRTKTASKQQANESRPTGDTKPGAASSATFS